MNKLYQLEQLVNNGGSQEEIDKLRAELGITTPKKPKEEVKVKAENIPKINNSPKGEEKPKKALTVEIYRDLKARGHSDNLIMADFKMGSNAFYDWKKNNGLTNTRKKQQTSQKPKMERIVNVETGQVEANPFTVLHEINEIPERPESAHYHTGSIDVWTFADENFNQDEVIGFHRINALKYIARYGKKNGKNVNDLKKAIVSIEKLIELEESTK